MSNVINIFSSLFSFQCNCYGDEFCESSKSHVSTCAAEVTIATHADTVVTCSAAQWICAADPQCATALEYYNRFCGAMFRGRKCTDRCINSIQILQRQTAAKKLETCYCDGSENYDCVAIKENMESLCYRKMAGETEDLDSNEIEGGKTSSSGWKLQLEKILLFVSLFLSAFMNMLKESFKGIMNSSSAKSNVVIKATSS